MLSVLCASWESTRFAAGLSCLVQRFESGAHLSEPIDDSWSARRTKTVRPNITSSFVFGQIFPLLSFVAGCRHVFYCLNSMLEIAMFVFSRRRAVSV
jgi:hypothetical protein